MTKVPKRLCLLSGIFFLLIIYGGANVVSAQVFFAPLTCEFYESACRTDAERAQHRKLKEERERPVNPPPRDVLSTPHLNKLQERAQQLIARHERKADENESGQTALQKYKADRERADIACHGSLEKAKRATYSCL